MASSNPSSVPPSATPITAEPTALPRSESQLTSTSERSLLNGSYSTFDNTSVESLSPSPTFRRPPQHDAILMLNLPAPVIEDPEKELAKLSIDRSYKHATWARTFHSRPEVFIRPKTTEDVQKAVVLARRCRRRLVTIGAAHSPSDLTCTSSWMMNLSELNGVLQAHSYDTPPSSPSSKDDNVTPPRRASMDKSEAFGVVSDNASIYSMASTAADSPPVPSTTQTKSPRYGGRILIEAGTTLHDLNVSLKAHGLTIPNLGSIDIQSIAGAIATGTHGSSVQHGLLSNMVRGLRIVLASGEAVWCSTYHRPDLFRAALVSLGALGIITELELEVASATNIEWESTVWPLKDTLKKWDADLWTSHEFVRCWWMPYTARMVVWRANKTSLPARPQTRGSAYAGWLGFHAYQMMLWIANLVPPLVPLVEKVIMGMQHGFEDGTSNRGVEEQRTGLLMDCLYSQFVNEWAIPLEKGPEAITRFEKWLLGQPGSGIPYDNKGLYAHSPIEVRATNGSLDPAEIGGQERAYLDPTEQGRPTLYLNATLYRPYGSSPPWMERYYEAFEWLMKEMGGRPHWAKNFQTVQRSYLEQVYGDNLKKWRAIRKDVDPEGMFIGDWHRRLVLEEEKADLPCEEVAIERSRRWAGGVMWKGEQVGSDAIPEALAAILDRKR